MWPSKHEDDYEIDAISLAVDVLETTATLTTRELSTFIEFQCIDAMSNVSQHRVKVKDMLLRKGQTPITCDSPKTVIKFVTVFEEFLDNLEAGIASTSGIATGTLHGRLLLERAWARDRFYTLVTASFTYFTPLIDTATKCATHKDLDITEFYSPELIADGILQKATNNNKWCLLFCLFMFVFFCFNIIVVVCV